MSNEKVELARENLNKLKDVVLDNIETVMKRGEALSDLEHKSKELSENSTLFVQNSRRVRRTLMWQNVKWTCLVLALLTLVVFILVTVGCGGLRWPRCV